MTTYQEIIKRWPSVGELASDLNVTPDLVRKWAVRDRIPVDYWLSLVKSAEKHDVSLKYIEMIVIEDRKGRE